MEDIEIMYGLSRLTGSGQGAPPPRVLLRLSEKYGFGTYFKVCDEPAWRLRDAVCFCLLRAAQEGHRVVTLNVGTDPELRAEVTNVLEHSDLVQTYHACKEPESLRVVLL